MYAVSRNGRIYITVGHWKSYALSDPNVVELSIARRFAGSAMSGLDNAHVATLRRENDVVWQVCYKKSKWRTGKHSILTRMIRRVITRYALFMASLGEFPVREPFK